LYQTAKQLKTLALCSLKAELLTAIQTVTPQRQDLLFHHGDTEGTEISQRHQGFSVHLRVLLCLRGEQGA